MGDCIRLLPDSVANQIAAGEVIQRPASVVKELVENSVDAGATEIKIRVKDAGKASIQVMDNGCGMSETDARMCFERHATSKISEAKDLFAIRTMGFRGEALASIAAVAHVEMKTRQTEETLGTKLLIAGSEVQEQEPVSTPNGTNIQVKNLFFNIPARRKFLKTTQTELKHIITEFQRIALSYPRISFSLIHNDSEIYHLPIAPIRQRIINLFGKNINQALVSIDTETTLARIKGYIGKPENAKKTYGEQYFFVNNRFMKHPYFHKAVTEAYDQLLARDEFPSYFIYFDIDPSNIDINIHPTKTEIKFEDERAVWQILNASVRESLGKFNIVPSLDFDRENSIDIPIFTKNTQFQPPRIEVNPEFNPFEEEKKKFSSPSMSENRENPSTLGWEKLYHGIRNTGMDEKYMSQTGDEPRQLEQKDLKVRPALFQVKNKYILSTVKSGLMLIDQKRAHERILFEKFLKKIQTQKGVAQKTLFPVTVELNGEEFQTFKEIEEEIQSLGFDIRDLGNNSVIINGLPSESKNSDPKEILEIMLEEYHTKQGGLWEDNKERLAHSMAKAAAIPYGRMLAQEEMQDLVDNLFACQSPNYSPDGKMIIHILPLEEIENTFNR